MRKHAYEDPYIHTYIYTCTCVCNDISHSFFGIGSRGQLKWPGQTISTSSEPELLLSLSAAAEITCFPCIRDYFPCIKLGTYNSLMLQLLSMEIRPNLEISMFYLLQDTAILTASSKKSGHIS